MTLVIEACTDKLKKWLDSVPIHRSETNRRFLLGSIQSQPYLFSETDVHDVLEIHHGQIKCVNGVSYWAQLRHKCIETLNSKFLKETFQHVEKAPLICLLDDFLPMFDAYLNELEKLEDPEMTDGKFLEGLEYYCLLKTRLHKLKYNWRMIVNSSLPPNCSKGFVDSHQVLITSTLSQLVDKCHSIIHKSHSMNRKPYYVQLCESLNLSNKEIDAMSYVFMRNSGVIFSKLYNVYSFNGPDTIPIGGSHSNSMAMEASFFAEMRGCEMYDFFCDSRTHMQQEIFRPEDEFSTILSTSFLVIPPTIIKACYGSTLAAEELYKIDKTAMGDIINKERSTSSELPIKETKEALGTAKTESDSELVELEAILQACDEIQQKVATDEEVTSEEIKGEGEGNDGTPYKDDLEYLEDNFELIETLVKARKTEMSDDVLLVRSDQRRPEAVIREMKAKARSCMAKINSKMELTRSSGAWLPRLERLAELRRLDKFEKNVLLTLTGCMVWQNLRDSGSGESVFRYKTSIGMLISLFCEGLGEQIKARVYFYRNSRLVSEGLVQVSDPPLLSRGNFLDCGVELDRRLLDYIVGLDTEINELVDGSDLYVPDTTLSDVALPIDQRQLLLNTFDSFEKFQKTCRDLKLNTRGYNKGLCLLFYGASGTGKTMTANAVANYLCKKLLLVTVSILTEAQLTKDMLRFLFREAKIHNAVIFFDECEPLFETRDNKPNATLALLLTEIEQYDGIIFLATNRHQDLDEAMHRRIQLALPFAVPDFTLRKEIWKSHVPDQLADKEIIDWTSLAQSYELTGGLIRNAVLSAISLATKKDQRENKITLSTDDLHKGAKLQLRGLLEMIDFERRIVPTYGLDELVLETSTYKHIETLINTGKTHKFISTQWGFNSTSGENVARATGIVSLLCGPAGVGKSSIAHAIGYELGQPIKEANCTELLSHTVSTNPRASRGIASFFKDAQRANAIIVLDGAEFVLGSVSSLLLSGLVGCETYTLAYQIEHYPGMIILTSRQEVGMLDLSRLPKLRFVIPLRSPSVSLREKLWRKLLPKKLPISSDIDIQSLAERFAFTGGEIAQVICSAAEVVAATNGSRVTNELLVQAGEDHLKLDDLGKNNHLSLFQ